MSGLVTKKVDGVEVKGKTCNITHERNRVSFFVQYTRRKKGSIYHVMVDAV